MRIWATAVVGLGALLAPTSALGQLPLGVVDQRFGRFDPDTLQPVGRTLESAETHTAPVLSPDGRRFAMGVSSPGSPGTPGRGRVGLWLGGTAPLALAHEVRTGIAAEAVVYPGVVAALLQDGALVVVDPDSGTLRSRRRIGWTHCAPRGVQTADRGVIVNAVRAGGVEVAVVEPGGRVRTLFVRLETGAANCRKVALVASATRAYIVGRRRAAELDPVTRRVSTHAVAGRPTSAAIVPGGLAVAGAGGLHVYEAAGWQRRWSDRAARSVLASGGTVVASGGGLRAREAATGRLLWRAHGSASASAVAAGHVYALPAIRDLATGERRGTHPPVFTALRLTEG